MLSSGEVVELDLGIPVGREAGFGHPAVLVTAQRVLDADPAVIQVVPLTTTIRPFRSEVLVDPHPANALDAPSAAQCQLVGAVSTARVHAVRGNVGPVVLHQIREALALILDLPE